MSRSRTHDRPGTQRHRDPSAPTQRRQFYVLGAGSHGRVVAEAVRSLGHRVAAYVDCERRGYHSHDPVETPIVAEQRFFEMLGADDLPADCEAVALGVGDNRDRLALCERVPDQLLPPIVHPSAHVSRDVELGAGSVVLPGAIVHCGARVGKAVIVNTGGCVGHDSRLDNAAHIAPAATLCGLCSVGARTWIGAGATLIHQIGVGADALVGAGAVIIHDVDDRQKVVGNPGRVIGRVETDRPVDLPPSKD